MVTRRGFSLPAALLAIAALAGCGTKVTHVRGPVVKVNLDEYRITPQDVHVRYASLHHGRLKLVATDTGVLTHNVKVLRPNRRKGGRPVEIGGTSTAHPGETVTAKVTLGPGHYILQCTLGNHHDLGQTGTLVIEG